MATIFAAILTAANLRSGVSGRGFVIFTSGSPTWSTVAIGTVRSNLLWTNGFLTIVNLIGIWRWLGRQARHEDGRQAAKDHSAIEDVPSLVGTGSLIGGTLTGCGGTVIGRVVDGMMRCDGAALADVVVSEGGVGGVGERLHAVAARHLRFGERVTRGLCAADLARLPVLTRNDGPAAIEKDYHA
jgi:hypothetical protein